MPIVKKEETDCVEKYRRVTLLQTAYKMIFAAVLAKKLGREVEERLLS